MKITVIGCGRWGTFIAWYLDKTGHEVSLYGRESSAKFRELVSTRANEYLKLSESVSLVNDMSVAVDFAQVIIISVGAQAFRGLISSITDEYNMSDKTIVLCMKGLEIETGQRLSQVAREYLPESANVALWIGPGQVQDLVRGIPNCMIIDSDNREVKENLVNQFSSKLIRFYFGNDVIGNEIGAATKNVIGIAAGMLDGLGVSSLKGALMARATKEVSELIVKMGGQAITAYGLCHLGDYEATLFSGYSHNRKFGEMFVKGGSYTHLAEGAHTVRALMQIKKQYDVELPICTAVYEVIYSHADPSELLDNLFIRKIKNEFQ